MWPQNPIGKPQPANEPCGLEATRAEGRGRGGGTTPSASPRLWWSCPLVQLRGSGGQAPLTVVLRAMPRSRLHALRVIQTRAPGPAGPNRCARDPAPTCTKPASQSKLFHPGDANFRSLTEAEIYRFGFPPTPPPSTAGLCALVTFVTARAPVQQVPWSGGVWRRAV